MAKVRFRSTVRPSLDNPVKDPAAQAHFKALWQDPEYRAKMALRKCGRPLGSRDGISKKTRARFWKQARFEATLTMKKLEQAGKLVEADDYAREALHEALVTMRLPGTARDKVAAARLVLDFTMAKPASKSEITVNKAEEWLAAVAEDNDQADKGDASDA